MDMAKLIEAVKAHSGLDDGLIIQASEHGADTGWAGFTYTGDCCTFFDRHADMIEDWDSFRALLAWFTLEEAGRWLAAQREG